MGRRILLGLTPAKVEGNTTPPSRYINKEIVNLNRYECSTTRQTNENGKNNTMIIHKLHAYTKI
jgi:hypothetical protein